MNKTVAITGNIGAGKSHICKVFEHKFDIPVYNCDDNAYKLLNTNRELIFAMQRVFGQEMYVRDGRDLKWNKTFVVDFILKDKDAYAMMNDILRPFVYKDFMQWQFEFVHERDVPYTIIENALLFESGMYKLFDVVIDVAAATEVRFQRFADRANGISPAIQRMKFESILKKQLTTATKENLAEHMSYFRINNDGDTNVNDAVNQLHQSILEGMRIWD